MFDRFEKMLAKKGKKVSDVEKAAKSDVLGDLRDEASEKMSEKLGGLKSAAARLPDEDPKKLLGATEDGEEDESQESGTEDSDSHPGEEEHSEMSSDDIDKKIQMLQDLKKSMQDKKGSSTY